VDACSSTPSSAPRREKAVELFVRREDAEAFLDDVRADDEELAAPLRVEPVELDA
jgi:Tic22-like family